MIYDEMLKEFMLISHELKSNESNLSTVANLLSLIWKYNKRLSNEQFALLMEIPLDLLAANGTLKEEESIGAEANGRFFADNIIWEDSLLLGVLKEKFLTKDFYLGYIVSLVEELRNKASKLKNSSGFLLTIIENVIREDINIVNMEQFKSMSISYSKEIESLMEKK